MDNLITRVPSDIAGNEFAVHTDSLAGDAILNSLCLGDLLEAFVKRFTPFAPHTRRSYGGIHNKNLWLDTVHQESPYQGHGDKAD